MKASCNLVISCLFHILLCFLIISTSTESNLQITPNTTYTNIFTYTENTTSSQSQPYVFDIQFYDDGTILIYLVRDDNNVMPGDDEIGQCFEPILRIRIIHLNGTVTEINTNLDLDSARYSILNWNDEKLRSGDNLYWNDETLRSDVSLGRDEHYFKSLIEVNINKKGFLRVTCKGDIFHMEKCSVDINGTLSKNGCISLKSLKLKLNLPFLRHWPPLMEVMQYCMINPQ
ncbi:24367_t:CDS:2 [Gigaspora rosea]|nr:24367_t:CDS:2 [Gigaspora rosea]